MFPNLRPTEKVEVTLELFELCMKQSSAAWTCEIDGNPVACWGIIEITTAEPAVIWLFTTWKLPRFTFLREARLFVVWAVKTYGPLVAFGTPWLESLGFEPSGEEERYVRWQ